MAQSPMLNAEGVVRVTVTSDGSPLADADQLISLNVRRAVNLVPSARLVFRDGDMPNQAFPLSDAATLVPGVTVKISAGYGDSETAIFEGIVVRHGIRVTGDNDARLVVECRDKAVKMTIGRRNANYVDQKDSDILASLAGKHGLTADIEATTVQHKEVVQHYCSDWDYALARAEANGLLVMVVDGKFVAKAPDVASQPVLAVGYGEDLIEFHADVDARWQFSAAQAVAWDPAAQAIAESSEAAPASLNAQGNLETATLAEVAAAGTCRLQTSAPIAADVLNGWAKAQQLKSGLARLRGRLSFQGSANAQVGTLIELKGVGARFSGKVFVTGVDHQIVDGNWITEVEFGLSPNWFTERTDIVAPPAAGLLPGIDGLHTGVVKKLDEDPGGEQRIQVSVPVMAAETDGVWARLLQGYASNAFGAFFVPEIGDEVVLGYFDNDPSCPVVLGSLYSSKQVPPYAMTAENNLKAIVTRSKTKIEFDDDKKIITITTPANNKIVLSDDGKSILLQDQNANKVELAEGGITLDSPKDITVTAKGKVTIDAVGAVSISSKADVKSAGLNVACEAQVGFTGKGNASAELSAAGQTTVKGAMVMIN